MRRIDIDAANVHCVVITGGRKNGLGGCAAASVDVILPTTRARCGRDWDRDWLPIYYVWIDSRVERGAICRMESRFEANVAASSEGDARRILPTRSPLFVMEFEA